VYGPATKKPLNSTAPTDVQEPLEEGTTVSEKPEALAEVPYAEIAHRAIQETRQKADSMRGCAEVLRLDAEIMLKKADLLRIEAASLDRMVRDWDQMIEDAIHP
jgi:hypothetical protein